jgi:hypothetical protein
VKTLTAGPREVPELEVREHPPSTQNVDSGPPRGVIAEGLRAPTINVKTPMAAPREVSELNVWESSPSM